MKSTRPKRSAIAYAELSLGAASNLKVLYYESPTTKCFKAEARVVADARVTAVRKEESILHLFKLWVFVATLDF